MNTTSPGESDMSKKAAFSFERWREQFLLLVLRVALGIRLIAVIAANYIVIQTGNWPHSSLSRRLRASCCSG